MAELFAQGPRPAAVSIATGVNWSANFTVGLVYPILKVVLLFSCLYYSLRYFCCSVVYPILKVLLLFLLVLSHFKGNFAVLFIIFF